MSSYSIIDNLKKRKVEYENPYFQLAKDLFYIEMEPPLKEFYKAKRRVLSEAKPLTKKTMIIYKFILLCNSTEAWLMLKMIIKITNVCYYE